MLDGVDGQQDEPVQRYVSGRLLKFTFQMAEDDWDVSFGLADESANAPKIHVNDENDDSIEGNHDFTPGTPQASPGKTVNIPLSPQGAAAVASVPTNDPFASEASTGDGKSRWS